MLCVISSTVFFNCEQYVDASAFANFVNAILAQPRLAMRICYVSQGTCIHDASSRALCMFREQNLDLLTAFSSGASLPEH